MNPVELLRSVYFGDSILNKFVVDIMKDKVELHFNVISRIRYENGKWRYYKDEAIEKGVIVITKIKSILVDESGLIPNEKVYDIYALARENNTYDVIVEARHVNKNYISHDIVYKIKGENVYIRDPKKPGKKIME